MRPGGVLPGAPDFIEQGFFRDDFSGTSGQILQHVHDLGTHLDRSAIFRQPAQRRLNEPVVRVEVVHHPGLGNRRLAGLYDLAPLRPKFAVFQQEIQAGFQAFLRAPLHPSCVHCSRFILMAVTLLATFSIAQPSCIATGLSSWPAKNAKRTDFSGGTYATDTSQPCAAGPKRPLSLFVGASNTKPVLANDNGKITIRDDCKPNAGLGVRVDVCSKKGTSRGWSSFSRRNLRLRRRP